MNYQLEEKFLPELRIGTNSALEFTSLELAFNYIYASKIDHQLYIGLGGYIFDSDVWLSIPIGINVYPLENKSFGFHIELSPLINNPTIIRGSLGIRYRFQ